MGTRSTTKFILKREDKLKQLVSIYQQYDGYIEGKGFELVEFLKSKKMCNGIPVGTSETNLANGFGCLVAQYIKEIKEGVGNVYITEDDDCQEYDYQVIFDEDKYYKNPNLTAEEYIEIIVSNWGKEIFMGTPSELLEFKEKEEI